MPTLPRTRIRAVALSGVLGVVAASSMAIGVLAPAPAIAAPSSEFPAPALASLFDRNRVDELDRSAERIVLARSAERAALARTESLAEQRSNLLSKHAKAIKKEIQKRKAAARAAEILREFGYDPATKDPREIARQMMLNKYGWGDAQFQCYDSIIMRESRWIHTADNPNSSAYGIPQALPGSKMASAGADWRTNPATQIRWGLGYVKSRFGTPCAAWSFKKAHGWY